ncbi:MAG TPA: hypothetical protein VGL86_32135 [Polyangia bacterium]
MVLAGCSGTVTPAVPLHDGLNVLSADPAVGVSAAFVRDGRAVYLQTRVGPLKPENYRQEFPNEPQNEIDARAVDQEGRTFRLVIGGDQLIEPSWAKDMRDAPLVTTVAEGIQRQADFAMARDAADAFLAQAPAALADHVFHLSSMTREVPLESARLIARAATAENAMPGERAFTANGCTSNLQEGDLYAKSDYVIAQHSAVWGWNYNGCSSSWDESVVTCNHGTCANDGSMGYQCSSYSNGWSVWSYNALLDYWSRENNTTTNNGGNTGACWSGYGIYEVWIHLNGSGHPNHDCNDDSAIELDEIRNARYDQGTWGNCYNNGNSTMSAPGCP